MNSAATAQSLPVAAPARVLAVGAFLKNTACLLDGDEVRWSVPHGDLSTPDACVALERSLDALVAEARGPIAAIAHDLHPDFHSTRLAQRLAADFGVPAVAVQHHHAHVAVAQAECGLGDEAIVGLALDGVGLGSDGTAWGGEVLRLRGGAFERVAHLPQLTLPGGDVAARETWRMGAAVMHALGRGDEIESRFEPLVGATLARGVRTMLERKLNCPRTSSAGRWFDAAASALRLSWRQQLEAEAAIALEQAASAWLARHRPAFDDATPTLELLPLLGELLDEADAGRGAARFHFALASGLAAAAAGAAARAGTRRVALAGGCFFNRLLTERVSTALHGAGLEVLMPRQAGVGDSGLALGQAWAVALQLQARRSSGRALELEA